MHEHERYIRGVALEFKARADRCPGGMDVGDGDCICTHAPHPYLMPEMRMACPYFGDIVIVDEAHAKKMIPQIKPGIYYRCGLAQT